MSETGTRMQAYNPKRRIVIFLFLLLLSLLLFSPLLFLGLFPHTHEGVRYLGLAEMFKEALANGIIYPRWLPDYYGGYGYPVFVFYQPGIFYLISFVSVFTGDILLAAQISLVLLFFAGAAGVFKLVEEIGLDEISALFAAVMFLITPYLFVNLYVRGDLSELASIMILPWPLFFLLRLRRACAEGSGIETPAVLLSLSSTALLYTHPFTSMFFFPVLSLFAGFVCLELRNCRAAVLRFSAAAAASLALALALSSPYWLTAFQMKELVNYRNALGTHYLPEENVVYFPQFFSRFWGFGGSEPGIADDGMSFQLGLPHFLLAAAGFACARRNRLIFVSFLIYLVIILLMSPLAVPLWKHAGIFRYVQFPWRLLAVVALLQAICIAGCGVALTRIHPQVGIALLAVVSTLAVLFCYFDMFKFNAVPGDVRKLLATHRQFRIERLDVYESANEFLPVTVKTIPAAPRGALPIIEASAEDGKSCTAEEYADSSQFHMKFSISAQRTVKITVNQLYFPGWRVELDGARISDGKLRDDILPDGRMRVGIPSGEKHVLEAYYEGPPGWRTRNFIIALLFIAYAQFLKSPFMRNSQKNE